MTTWEGWKAGAERLEVGGSSVAGYDLGSPAGPVMTFLHGFPSSSLDIAPVLARLDGWRLVTLDFPGFGASAKVPGHPYSIHGAADAVEHLWRARGVAGTVLVAHDYGVSVAQELLARRAEAALPVEVEALVWMNGGLYPDLHRLTAGQQLLLDPDEGATFAAAVTEKLFVGGVEGTWGDRRPVDRAALHEMWRSMEDGGGVALMHELLHYVADRRTHQGRWREALEANDLPAAYVWGDLDPVSGAHVAERLAEWVPRSQLVRLPDVGHWPLLEAPDVVSDAIRSVRPA